MTKDQKARLQLRKSVLRVIAADQLVEVVGGDNDASGRKLHAFNRGPTRYCID